MPLLYHRPHIGSVVVFCFPHLSLCNRLMPHSFNISVLDRFPRYFTLEWAKIHFFSVRIFPHRGNVNVTTYSLRSSCHFSLTDFHNLLFLWQLPWNNGSTRLPCIALDYRIYRKHIWNRHSICMIDEVRSKILIVLIWAKLG